MVTGQTFTATFGVRDLATGALNRMNAAAHQTSVGFERLATRMGVGGATAGRSMMFMSDASDVTVRNMRRLASASQGVLLGLAAMERNILGVAFSLIFLQFSGVLRLSLALAGLTVVGASAVRFIQRFVAHRREVEQLANAFFIVTRSAEAFEVATQRAEAIAGLLGLTSDDTKDVIDGLVEAQLALRSANIAEPWTDLLEVFLNTMLQARASGDTWDEATQKAIKTMLDFEKEGESALVDVGGSTEELAKRGGAALATLGDSTITVRELIDLLPAHARQAQKEWAESLGIMDVPLNELDLVLRNRLLRIANSFGITQEQLAGDAEGSTERISQAFSEMGDRFESDVGEGSRTDRALKLFGSEIEDIAEQGPLTSDAINTIADEFRDLSDELGEEFLKRLEGAVGFLERLAQLDEDFEFDVGSGGSGAREPTPPIDFDGGSGQTPSTPPGEGDILPGPGQAPTDLPFLGEPPGMPILPGPGQSPTTTVVNNINITGNNISSQEDADMMANAVVDRLNILSRGTLNTILNPRHEGNR